MIRTLLIVVLLLLVLAVVIWVLDLVVAAVLNRINIPPDIKTAARAVLALVLFLVFMAIALSNLGLLPAGWW
jgi:hypothetical protein